MWTLQTRQITVKVKENEKRDEYLYLARELKKTMEHEGDGNTDCNWYAWNNTQRISKRTGRQAKTRINKDHPDYNIII